MTTTVVKTIGTTGDFSTPQLWEDGAPADLTTAEKSPANTFSGTFVQGESLTFTGSGATGKFLHTDNSTYIIYGLITGNPASGDSVAGATASCVLTSSTPDDTGVIWQGQCQNQEFSGATNRLSIAGSTSSSTAYKECTTVAGASFRDNANVQTNALMYNASNGAGLRCTAIDSETCVSVTEANTRIANLQISNAATDRQALSSTAATSFYDDLIIEGKDTRAGSSTGAALVGSTGTLRNSVVIQRSSVADHILGTFTGSPSLFNCAFVAPDDLGTAPVSVLAGDTGTVTAQNCGLFAGDSTKAVKSGTATFNFTTCYSDISGTAGVTQTTYSSEFQNVNDATRDFRLKTGAAQIDTGTTDATNAQFDIAGTERPEGAAYDVGCWELVQGGEPPVAPTLRVIQSGLIW